MKIDMQTGQPVIDATDLAGLLDLTRTRCAKGCATAGSRRGWKPAKTTPGRCGSVSFTKTCACG